MCIDFYLMNNIRLKFITDSFTFIDCVKSWDWEKCGNVGENIVRKKFDKEWEQGLWSSYRKLRSFNKNKCTCECLESCGCFNHIYDYEFENSRKFCTSKDCECPCECYFKLSEDDIKKIARCMKKWKSIGVIFSDLNFADHYGEDTTRNFRWFDNFLVDLFELSLSDIQVLSDMYEKNCINIYASSWNMLNIMSGHGSLRFSN